MKDASCREEHFRHWEFRSIFPHYTVRLILVRKPFGDFLIMIHGPSSLFIWRLVDVSKFSSLYDKMRLFERIIFVIETFGSISSHSRVILILAIENFAISFHIIELYWFSWESLRDISIMIHGPSSWIIWRLVDVSWFSSIDERCVFSRGTFLSLRMSLYLSSL